MKKIDFKKDKISIQNIGKQRFWFGIISGFISAITISLIINKTRELIRYLTSISEDLLTFENKELTFFNYFFVSLSTVLGLSITIWVWMGGSINKRKKHKLYKQQVRTNTQLIFWLVLFLIAQLGCLFLFLILAKNSTNYGHSINLYEDHSILFILIPIVIFAQNWFLVRLIYKTGKWIFISVFVSVITTLILYKTTTVDQNKLNDMYFTRYEKEYNYVELEKSKAKKKYGVKYNKTTIEILKQWRTQSARKQVRDIKEIFSKEGKLSIDTIILQKIIIHNHKIYSSYRYHSKSRPLNNWQYALPENILKQIMYFECDSNETKELFETLKEEIILVNKSKIELNNYEIYERINNLEPKVNIELVKQLIRVSDSLKSLKKYSELNKLLPEIKNVP
ncbi:hypothetical protein [Polaribacter sp. Asnod6-C07]|uniref:hypothetical protein n=1 Tax=Polaribacter sp. Asnod6-C07 TaxID=3160582 RepID=UPI00386986E5